MRIVAEMLAVVVLVASSANANDLRSIACEGHYPRHLQGVCSDRESLFWCFTTTLVKTDLDGKLLKKVAVASHHGDLCHVDGKLYVAVNLGKFNDPKGNANSWVYVYDAATLQELARHEIQQVFHGAGGIAFREGRFFVVGGLPKGVNENSVYEYDKQFQFLRKHVVASGWTDMGIQTATFAHGRWWFGCYGHPRNLLITDSEFRVQGTYEFDCSMGIEAWPDGRLLVASGNQTGEGYVGMLQTAAPDEKAGLKVLTAGK